jgi:hypothetical protein
MNATLLVSILVGATPDVLRVDASQGPYTEIRDAVSAAAPGDLILVEPGGYAHFGVIGKGLTVAARISGTVHVNGTVRVQSVPAGAAVSLSGLNVVAATIQIQPALRLFANAGAVRVEDSSFESHDHYGVFVESSTDVVLHRCTALSNRVSGLGAVTSTLAIHGGSYTGASFGQSAWTWGFSGGHGIQLDGCTLLTSKVRAQGGNGGDEYSPGYFCNLPPGAGGDGIFGRDSTIEVLDSDLHGGSAALAIVCPQSPSGLPVHTEGASTVTMHPGVAVQSNVTHDVAVEGTPYFVQVVGAAATTVILLVGPEARRTDLPGAVGDLLVGGSLGSVRRLDLGLAPTSRQLVAPILPPFGILALHFQALQDTPMGLVFGPPQVLTVIDSAW